MSQQCGAAVQCKYLSLFVHFSLWKGCNMGRIILFGVFVSLLSHLSHCVVVGNGKSVS